ncbi:hypothetical protein [Acetanaerobacterium elongatum]|uniref:Site-specific DNA recombinase n=1 Tax=Acetanaerobacterium elongatum TaxID=258515 RepID=A0A1H0EBF1_9FIRM|nr:hypothetical protein [Acetanaerobacterium elongatum]SDN79777.1 hypothetical protein SAMN05192585_13242 [Acetanaerobacterium elongatum]
MNSLITDKSKIIVAYHEVISILTDNSAFQVEAETLQSECDIVLELMRKMVEENSRNALDQGDYKRRYDALVERYDNARDRLSEVSKTIDSRNDKRQELERFLQILKKQEGLLTEFDEDLWLGTVHQLIVRSKTEFVLVFKDGTELPWTMG